MLTRSEKITLTVFGVVGCPIILAPIPFLLAKPEHQNIWIAIGLLFSIIALIQMFVFESYKYLIIFVTPNLTAIVSGVGAAMHQVLILGNAEWFHRYAMIVLFTTTTFYSSMLIILVMIILDKEYPWYPNSFLVKLTLGSLVLYFSACPIIEMIYTAAWTWIYANYGMIILFILLFTIFIKFFWKEEAEPVVFLKKSVRPSFAVYSIIYTPLAIFTMIQGLRECQMKADLTVSSQYCTFIPAMLGSICSLGIAAAVVAPIVIFVYALWLGIKKLFRIQSHAPMPVIAYEDLEDLENQNELVMNESFKGHPLEKYVVDIHFEETTESMCSICWEEFKKSDKIKKVSRCNHIFHSGCLACWSKKNQTCPLCRANLSLSFKAPHEDDYYNYDDDFIAFS